MYSISIIGSGNVAIQLITTFSKSNTICIKQVYSRKPIKENGFKNIHDFKKLIPVDLLLICVSDNAIASVTSQIQDKNQLIAHTSGSLAIDEIANSYRKAVFYPLQTFSKNIKVPFQSIPICIEASNEKDLQIVKTIASSISAKVFEINSEQRQNIHLAAVFVNNFTNHLYKIASDLAQKNDFPFEILHELIKETTKKAIKIGPKNAQTGPAKRNDSNTINLHLSKLENSNYKKIYQLLTDSIQKNG